jgi:hypothetical protein
MEIDADRRYKEAACKTQRGGEHRAARPTLFDPAPQDGGRSSEEDDGQAEDPAKLGQLPVPGCRLRDPDKLSHRQVEHTEGIGLADAQMDAERGRGN